MIKTQKNSRSGAGVGCGPAAARSPALRPSDPRLAPPSGRRALLWFFIKVLSGSHRALALERLFLFVSTRPEMRLTDLSLWKFARAQRRAGPRRPRACRCEAHERSISFINALYYIFRSADRGSSAGHPASRIVYLSETNVFYLPPGPASARGPFRARHARSPRWLRALNKLLVSEGPATLILVVDFKKFNDTVTKPTVKSFENIYVQLSSILISAAGVCGLP